jgi:hypothetical protein
MSQQNLGDSRLSSTYQKTESFLLIHVALLAAVPLVMVLCMMGLAVGDPVFPGWLETLVLGLPPIGLTVWIQWQKPLYPFSLWIFAKPAAELSDSQRRVLSVLRRRINGWYTGAWVAVVAGVFLYVVFRQIYITAPLAADIAPFPPVLRLIGILWAEVFFLIGNLLLQMGSAAARVMLLPPSEFNSLAPYEKDRISKDFTIVGMRSPNLLAFATELQEPIQQTAELITDQPEPAQLPASGTKQTIADKLKPLFAQLSGVSDTLSGLLHKVSTLLPIKTPSESPSAGSGATEVPSPSKVDNLETEVGEQPIEATPVVPDRETNETVEGNSSLQVEAAARIPLGIATEAIEEIVEKTTNSSNSSEEISEEVPEAVQESTSDDPNDTQARSSDSSSNAISEPQPNPSDRSIQNDD